MSDAAPPDVLSDWLALHRPALFRYCARMTGSVSDGEDAVQDTLLKTMQTFPGFGALADPKAWLFRVAHNAAIDILRARQRAPQALSDDLMDAVVDPGASSESRWVARSALRHFMWLTPAERSCVVLMDVLDHTLLEIAEITGKTTLAVKSALHRGRTRLKEVAESPQDLPPLDAGDLVLLDQYAQRFNARDFEGVRALLSEEVRLDLVGRVKLHGKTEVSGYVGRYATQDDWKFVPGVVEGQPAMVVIDPRDARLAPLYFVLLRLEGGLIARIRDFRYARYANDVIDWATLYPAWRAAPSA
jgi:RNA polymerase sigma-70 factor (ECF subfamily)